MIGKANSLRRKNKVGWNLQKDKVKNEFEVFESIFKKTLTFNYDCFQSWEFVGGAGKVGDKRRVLLIKANTPVGFRNARSVRHIVGQISNVISLCLELLQVGKNQGPVFIVDVAIDHGFLKNGNN